MDICHVRYATQNNGTYVRLGAANRKAGFENRIKSPCLKAGLKEPFIEEINDFVGVSCDRLRRIIKIILIYI